MMQTEMTRALDVICPMHMILDVTGHITHAGPIWDKLSRGKPLPGSRFLEHFEAIRPRHMESMADLSAAAGTKLRVRMRDCPRTTLSGVLMPLADGAALINLSFGISIVDAVRDHTLTNSDFAPTDLAIEMLYLVEAKSAAMEALRQMSLRFHGARIAAEEQALTDSVTGLKNRRALELVLARLIDGGQEFALMHIDLDYFKQVNDTFGHAAGDHVLSEVARLMVEETRGGDTVARVGGDEFVVVFHRLCDRERLADIAGRLIARIEEPIEFEAQDCRISASAGTAISLDYSAPDAERIVADADAALYEAKRSGRGRHCFHDENTGRVASQA